MSVVPTTANTLRKLIATFPSVDDRYPEWAREEGKKGRLSAAEKAAQEANAKERETYQLVLDDLQVAINKVADLEYNYDSQTEYIKNSERNLQKTARQQSADKANSLLGLVVLAQLAALMKDSEFEPSNRSSWGDTVTMFTNRHGRFELHFGAQQGLYVTPANKKLQPITVSIDGGGLTSDAVLILKGHLGLNAEAITKRVKPILHKEDPKTAELEEFFGLLNSISTMVAMRGMFAKNRKPGSGQ
jgi:hypothetical protein